MYSPMIADLSILDFHIYEGDGSSWLERESRGEISGSQDGFM